MLYYLKPGSIRIKICTTILPAPLIVLPSNLSASAFIVLPVNTDSVLPVLIPSVHCNTLLFHLNRKCCCRDKLTSK